MGSHGQPRQSGALTFLAIVGTLALGALLVLSRAGWYAFLSIALPAALALLLAWQAWSARRGVRGFELVLLGIVLALAFVGVSVTGAPGLGPPLSVLPLLFSAAVCLAFGIAVIAVNHAGPSSQPAGERHREALRLLLRLLAGRMILVLAGTLHWIVIASGRGGFGLVDMLGHAVFVIVFGAAVAPVLARGVTSAGRAVFLLLAPPVAGLAALLGPAADVTGVLVHVAAIDLLTLLLVLPILLSGRLARGDAGSFALMAFAGGVAVLLGWESGVDLWQELRFAEGLGVPGIGAWIGLPALGCALVLLPGRGPVSRRGGDQAVTEAGTGPKNAR